MQVETVQRTAALSPIQPGGGELHQEVTDPEYLVLSASVAQYHGRNGMVHHSKVR